MKGRFPNALTATRPNTFGSAWLLWQGPTIITVAEPPRNAQDSGGISPPWRGHPGR
jgi:hypothetical protein